MSDTPVKIPIVRRLTYGDVISAGFDTFSSEEQRSHALKANKLLRHAVCDKLQDYDKWYQKDEHFVPIKVGDEKEELDRNNDQLWIKDQKGMDHPQAVQGFVTVTVMESIIRREQMEKPYPYSV